MVVTAKEYQTEIKEKLSKIFSIPLIEIEKRMEIPAYSPRVDVAIPPFAFEGRYSEEYNILLNQNELFFNVLKDKAINKEGINFNKNSNPRCFLAIEVENTTGDNAKHILGSIANTSILGKIGIVVTMNSDNCLQRISNYLDYVTHAGKISEEFKNVILINKSNFDEVLNQFLPSP